jgi:hypothetical protein
LNPHKELDGRMLKMTMDGFLDLLVEDKHWERIVDVVGQMLSWVEDYYLGYEDDCCASLFRIARTAIVAEDIDKDTARDMARCMALLADRFLQEEGAGWDFETLIALKKIRRADPELRLEEERKLCVF